MTYQYLSQNQLRLHPENIRSYIADEDAAKMGQSIKAHNGVLQALLVVPHPNNDNCYLVVDGNMRLAGARTLGKQCPLLKCEIIDADRAKQHFVMATTSHHHYPKAPVDEARHYQRLRDEGFTIKDIADQTGVSKKTIGDRLKILNLPSEVQEMINTGQFTKDHRAVSAILGIDDPGLQTQLVKKLANTKRVSIPAIQAAAGKVAQSTNKKTKVKVSSATAIPIQIMRKFMAQLVVHLKTDADLLEEAAIAVGDIDEGLELQLLNRVADLRNITRTATGGKYG